MIPFFAALRMEAEMAGLRVHVKVVNEGKRAAKLLVGGSCSGPTAFSLEIDGQFRPFVGDRNCKKNALSIVTIAPGKSYGDLSDAFEGHGQHVVVHYNPPIGCDDCVHEAMVAPPIVAPARASLEMKMHAPASTKSPFAVEVVFRDVGEMPVEIGPGGLELYADGKKLEEISLTKTLIATQGSSVSHANVTLPPGRHELRAIYTGKRQASDPGAAAFVGDARTDVMVVEVIP